MALLRKMVGDDSKVKSVGVMIQGCEDPQDALSFQVVARQRALSLVAI